MTRAAAATRYAAVTVASRQALTTVGPCEVGDVLGLVDGDIVVVGADVAAVARDILERMLAIGGELVTLVTGVDATAELTDEPAGLARRALPADRGRRLPGWAAALADHHGRGVTPSDPFLRQRLSAVVGGRTATALAQGPWPGDRRGPPAPLPAALRGAGRADRAVVACARGSRSPSMAEVRSVTVRPMRQRRGTILEAIVTDGRESMSLTFFNQKWREGELRAGRRGLFSGQVTRFRGQAQLTHPEFILLPDGVEEDPLAALDFAGALIPIYPSAKSVTSWQLQKAIGVLVEQMGELPDPIPREAARRAWAAPA